MALNVKLKSSKQSKYICPNHCNCFRMLNRTANLALCSNCGAQMVPEFTKVAKRKKYVENKHPQPFSCDKCGNTNVSVLTHLGKRGNWCYNCLKDKTADETWTKKKISNA